MRVDQLINLLSKIPGDYSVGMYHAPLLSDMSYRHLDGAIGVSNDTRRVAISFGIKDKATVKELREVIELK